ncbi:MAG: molybdate ABC transporter substrate-binding protein [Candidatus Polarisedimenticolia bacterium]
MITLLIGLVLAFASPAPDVVVYAAASLRDALQESAPACERAVGAKLLFNFGASNDLARQIQAGNKADVYFSADESWMDKVAADGLVDTASRRALLSNRLVIVAAPDVQHTIGGAADLARAPVRFISMADPEAVPAGKYAKAWLVKQGQWEAVRPRVLPGVDVRAALAAVESGGAELGIVYATDAAISRKVRVVYTVPGSEGPIIRYSLAALRDRPNLVTSQAVVAWMAGPDAARVFERFGFVLLEEP